MIAKTPTPPYYAVIFTSQRVAKVGERDDGYAAMAAQMVELAAQQPGFLGIESAREDIGITVSYWKDLESIAAWKQVAEHREAQRRGRSDWYAAFRLRISKVEREYGMNENTSGASHEQ